MNDKSTTTASLSKFMEYEEKLYRALFSEHETASLLTALDRKMFEIVRESDGITRDELLEKAKLGPKAGEAIVAILTALGYFKVVDKKYYLTEFTEEYFSADPDKNTTVLFKEFTHCSALYMRAIKDDKLTETKQQDMVDTWKAGKTSEEVGLTFSNIMDVMHRTAADKLAQNVNFHEQFGIRSILDVGGGSGCYSLKIAKQQPGMKMTVCELENVCKASETYINKQTLPTASKVNVFPGDMFKGIFPKNDDPEFGYQAVFLSDIIHDWDQKACELICKNIYEALPEDGYIILNEMVFNDDFSGPLITALFSFTMFLYTQGKQRSFAELKSLLKTSGFTDICKVSYGSPYTLIIGKKSTQ